MLCGSSRTCLGHLTTTCGHLGNPKYDGYCTHCFKHLFKDDPRVQEIRTKSKETKWVNEILTHLPLEGWVWDKPIYVDFDGGCCATKRRIDLRILVEHPTGGLFWLCIEIDENQHKSYVAGYDAARYNDLFMDFTGKYVFLRVNPDPFRRGEEKVDTPFEERFQHVYDMITSHINDGPQTSDLVEVYHFFYDVK